MEDALIVEWSPFLNSHCMGILVVYHFERPQPVTNTFAMLTTKFFLIIEVKVPLIIALLPNYIDG